MKVKALNRNLNIMKHNFESYLCAYFSTHSYKNQVFYS